MKKRYLVSPIGRGMIPAGVVGKDRITAPTEVEMEESRVAKVRKFGKVVELAESRVVKVSKFGKVAELTDEENKKVINEEPIVKTVDDNTYTQIMQDKNGIIATKDDVNNRDN